MKRHALVAAIAVPHLLAAIILLTRMGMVASMTWSQQLSAEVVRAIWLQTAVLSIPALLLLLGVAGLWLARPWGWRAAAAADVILIALVASDWLLGGQRVDHGPVLAILAILLVPLLVPRVQALLQCTAGSR